MWWSSFLFLGTLAVGYYVYSSFQAYWRLRQFRGPPLAAFSNLWWLRVACSGKAHLILTDTHDKYGQLCRIGPNTLLSSDEELQRKMSAVRSPYQRSDWYKAFKFDADRENMFSETNDEKHMRMRNRVSNGYAGKDNPNLEADIDRVMWTLFGTIKDKFLSEGSVSKPMDFATAMQYYTLDIITSLSLGQPFNYIADFEDKYEYVRTMAENMPAMTFMSAMPQLSRLIRIPAIQRAVLPSVKDKIGMGKIKAVTREILAKRFGPDAEKHTRHDMTQSFINHGLSKEEIGDESLLQIMAGSDTVSTVLRSGFIQIIANPQIYTKLQAECDAAQVPIDEIVSNSRALQLPFLNAVVKEMLRYHPAGVGLMPRVVGPEGDTYNGKFIPPGTEIGFCAWKVYRKNYAAYGQDVDVFRPARWLEASADDLVKMEKASDLLFGHGRFKCVGERIAKIEILKTTFELMRRYNFSFINAVRPMETNIDYGVWIQRGMWVRVEERRL